MDRKNWPVKMILGGAALMLAISDLTFGTTLSSGALLLVGGMLVAEAFGDRSETRGK